MEKIEVGWSFAKMRVTFRVSPADSDENNHAHQWHKLTFRALSPDHLKFLVVRQYHENRALARFFCWLWFLTVNGPARCSKPGCRLSAFVGLRLPAGATAALCTRACGNVVNGDPPDVSTGSVQTPSMQCPRFGAGSFFLSGIRGRAQPTHGDDRKDAQRSGVQDEGGKADNKAGAAQA
ncbi:hypothetical protein [Solimonas aquatica]|uniref:hypothetical protein n=1 Tax=Solimonas aquatica TaxID=489703 RepID=UPI001160976F|nr:hypothetical protein [Solimonas aquatica]